MSIRNLVFPLFAFISLISCDNEGFTPEPIPRQQFIIDNPQQYGFDAAVLQNVSDYAGSINNFYALMVIRDGTVIMENYYNGTGADAQFELRSITKNFSSCLAGMAIEEGLIDNLDETIQSSFPESVEGDKAGISIRHLLNMTSGISWNEDSDY
ncbi:MAG: serine hydrolase, partial [Bacteroidota bacterium]